ncbi:MAG: SRPBCC domain-containing protein [Bryobacteraceae bacterium]|nr:SRPBCC domain-containing protein [Bryobacteraceae bacterium]
MITAGIPTLEITKTESIAATIDIVFESILEQMGPYCEAPDGSPLPMKLEAWPGGRWYRDLGENSGHLWAHVQSIRAPNLLELQGPLFMSAPALNHVLYRLTEEAGMTVVRFTHRAVGLVPPGLLDGVNTTTGWTRMLSRVRAAAENRK